MDSRYKNILKKHNFTFKKAFGQNFLSDHALLEDIVVQSGITKEDTVLEIGCGAGALTQFLCKRAKRFVGYEIDEKLKPILSEVLEDYSNYEIVFKDVLKEKIQVVDEKLGKNFVLVANLPYYITTPIILQFLENSKNIKAMVVMVQEEVADRLCAKNANSEYGAITVAINLRGKATKIYRVGREKFYPIPNVDSAVVKIEIDCKKFENVDLLAVREVVKCAFQNRRKTLVNNLMRCFSLAREEAENIIAELGHSNMVRGEELTAEDYVNLTEKIKGLNKWKK